MGKEENKREMTPSEKKGRRRRRFLRTMIVVAGILVIVRIALPVVALRLVNKKLAGMPDYICHVDDLDISIIGRSVTLRGIEMKKKNGKVAYPFFKCNQIHVHVESFKHRASEIKVDSCVINLVKGKNKAASQLSLDEGWIQLAKEMPLKPNTFIVNSGEVHYREIYKKQNIDLAMKEVKIDAENLENLKGITDSLPSRVTLAGLVEGAKLKSVIQLDKQKDKPEVKAATSLSPIQLRLINGLLRHYTQFDVEKGTFSMNSHFHIRNNRINGVAIPVVKDLVLFDRKKDKDKPFGKRVTEAVIQVGANLLKKEDDKIIAKVEINGAIKNPKLNVWQIILSALSDSFHQSVKKGLENPANLHK